MKDRGRVLPPAILVGVLAVAGCQAKNLQPNPNPTQKTLPSAAPIDCRPEKGYPSLSLQKFDCARSRTVVTVEGEGRDLYRITATDTDKTPEPTQTQGPIQSRETVVFKSNNCTVTVTPVEPPATVHQVQEICEQPLL